MGDSVSHPHPAVPRGQGQMPASGNGAEDERAAHKYFNILFQRAHFLDDL